MAAIAFGVALCASAGAFAVPIVYVFESDSVTGTIGTTAFSNKVVRIEMRGDTDGIQGSFDSRYNSVTATMTIQSVGTFTITPPVGLGSALGLITMRLGPTGFDVMGIEWITNYDLATPLGVIRGDFPMFVGPRPIPTSGGNFLWGAISVPTLFQSYLVEPVPALGLPAVALLILGLVALAYRAIARRH